MGYSPHVCELLDQVYQLKLDVAFYKGATDAEPVTAESIRKLGLNHNESLIYAALMAARPNILSIYSLEQIAPAKDPTKDRSANFIHTMVCLIRKKIGEDAIECVHSRGFRIADDYQPPA